MFDTLWSEAWVWVVCGMGCGPKVVRSPVRRGGQSFAEQLSISWGGGLGGSNPPPPPLEPPPP